MSRTASAIALCLVLVSSGGAARALTGFREEVVSFTTHDDRQLDGILSYPSDGSGPYPGVLLIHGSGLHDADLILNEPLLRITRGEQRLFRSLARFLSRRGFAVYRYNKRGASFEHAEDQPALLRSSTIDDLVEDAHNAFRALVAHPLTAASPLTVYGHSEGTLVGSRLALREPRVDLLVLVGSVASKMKEILRYQLVDRIVNFLEEAPDADGDGLLTLEELDALDGNHGLGSLWIRNIVEVLYLTSLDEEGEIVVLGLSSATDSSGDDRLDIRNEIEPILEREAEAIIASIRAGDQGRYLESLVAQRGALRYIHKIRSRILFAQGELDAQTPVEETLALIAKLERRKRDNWDAVFFPKLGHSLSKPNDFYDGDGGLSILDNPTLNAMGKRTMKKILARIRAALD